MKRKLALTVIGMTAIAMCSQTALATSETTTFDSLPSATFGGSGIPNTQVEITTIGGISDPFVQSGSDTITIGLSAHARFAIPGDLANNGNGTYVADPGSQSGRALWNTDFDLESSAGFIGRYQFTMTIALEGGSSITIDPRTAFSDNTGGPGSAQNSENLTFGQFSGLGFNPNTIGIYDITVVAHEGDAVLGSDTIHVNVGNARSVPDGGETAGLLVASCFGLFFMKKHMKKITRAGSTAAAA
jgi:hypothetical protein